MNAEELRAAFAKLPDVGNAVPYSWDRHRKSFKRHVAEDDPLKFLRWSTTIATMFVGNAKYILYELNYLNPEWRRLIEEPWFGDAIPYYRARYTSGNLIHQAFHLKIFEDLSQRKIRDMESIYEFGGGYGAMALMARRLGFTGKYIIQDLPELSLLQKFYLSNIGVEAECVTDLPERRNYDLFVGCFSVSEVDLEMRAKITDAIEAKFYLFAFQHVWENINNENWFMEFVEEHNMRHTLRWMDHMEAGPNYHLVMWR